MSPIKNTLLFLRVLPKPNLHSRFISSTTMSSPYTRERLIAELAVQRACKLTNKVFHSLVKGTVTKDDKSPVTSTPTVLYILFHAHIHSSR